MNVRNVSQCQWMSVLTSLISHPFFNAKMIIWKQISSTYVIIYMLSNRKSASSIEAKPGILYIGWMIEFDDLKVPSSPDNLCSFYLWHLFHLKLFNVFGIWWVWSREYTSLWKALNVWGNIAALKFVFFFHLICGLDAG